MTSKALDKFEAALVADALSWLERRDLITAERLRGDLERLIQLCDVADRTPSLLTTGVFGPLERTPLTLVDRLCGDNDGLSVLSLPTRAVIGEATLLVKIQVLRGLLLALRLYPHEAPPALVRRCQDLVHLKVNTRMLEELLSSAIRRPDIPVELRQRAAVELVHVWESPHKMAVADFFPTLDTLWRARSRVHVTWGALTGVTELFRLVREECPAEALTFFLRQEVSSEEEQAFAEFLFGVPWEDLARLRSTMTERGLCIVDAHLARETLGELGDTGPESAYLSWSRRHKAASLRRTLGGPGPRNTAECYLLLHLLQQGSRPIRSVGLTPLRQELPPA